LASGGQSSDYRTLAASAGQGLTTPSSQSARI